MKPFFMGEQCISDQDPPVFLPDIGTFFNQDIEAAKDQVNKLKKAGVKFIKGEILHDANIALDKDVPEKYLAPNGKIIQEKYRNLVDRKIVTLAKYHELFYHCKQQDLGIVVSVYDFVGAEFAKSLGACCIKIASSNIVHQPLIEQVAKLGLPMIIDTGKSSLEEIARAINWAEDAGAEMIMIQHSPEAPPSSVDNHNLRMIPTLRQIFDRPVGLSDHHHGNEMLYVAIALGASSLEKGVCLHQMQSDQDTYHAIPVNEVSDTLEKCLMIYRALGVGMRYLRRDRVKYASRMGLCASRIINKGDKLDLSNISFAFPAVGIPVESWDHLKNFVTRVDIPAGEPITWKDVEPGPA